MFATLQLRRRSRDEQTILYKTLLDSEKELQVIKARIQILFILNRTKMKR